MMELLSPAGHWEAMVAAVQNGANAVYMGFGDYNARRGARNFSQEEYQAAVSYCHLRGVKVYLTLNTLLSDRELPKALEVLRLASRWGVDGVIVQDWGVLAMAREALPDLPLHGSTQMSIHTRSGVDACAGMGLRCVVLARELSGAEVAAICKDSPIRIETFAHGALCMCYSGQCAMSALIGGRSGNRGTCAQPCRLPYRIDNNKTGYPLSLKDASLADHLQECAGMGVEILKLEGRMKRPEYVAVITGIYARLLRENRRPTAEEERQLTEAFSRSGFTDGYWKNELGPAMFGTRAESTPEPKELFAAAKAAYDKENLRLVDVTFTGRIAAGVPAELTAADPDGHTVTVTGDVPEAARSRSITAEDIAARLQKTGGTAFRCAAAQVDVEEGLSLSAAAVNALRRSALEALETARTAPPLRRELPLAPLTPVPATAEEPRFTVSVMQPDQLTAELMACRPAVVSVPVQHIGAVDIAPYTADTAFSVELPRVWRDQDEPLLRQILADAKARGYTAVNIQNIGQLALAKDSGLTLRGDYGLNVFNSRSLDFLRQQGLESATVSFELRHEQVRDLRKSIPCEAIVYGRLPLMIMENCIISNQYRCKSGDLHGVCAKPHTLTDRRGETFPVCPQWGCRNEIENAKTLFLADKPEFRRVGLTWARLRFTTETPEACAAMLSRYTHGGTAAPEDLTRGLFYRGVE